jgi:hypothetical protein
VLLVDARHFVAIGHANPLLLGKRCHQVSLTHQTRLEEHAPDLASRAPLDAESTFELPRIENSIVDQNLPELSARRAITRAVVARCRTIRAKRGQSSSEVFHRLVPTARIALKRADHDSRQGSREIRPVPQRPGDRLGNHLGDHRRGRPLKRRPPSEELEHDDSQ